MSRWRLALHESSLSTWLRRSLGARIVLLSLGLLALVQISNLAAIRFSIERNARQSIADELEIGERVLRHVLTQNAQKLREGASLLAADPGFRAAMNGNDDHATSLVLADRGHRFGATVALLLDPSLRVRAAGEAELLPMQGLTARLAADVDRARSDGEVGLLGDRPYQFVMVPVRTSNASGWLLMGSPIDQQLLGDVRDLSLLQASLVVRQSSTSWRTVLSTLPSSARPLLENRSGKAWTHGEAGPTSLKLPDGEYGVRQVALTDDGSVEMLLMLSVDGAIAPYRQLRLVLIALAVLGVVTVAAGAFFTARHVTAPIHRLVAATERLGAGDYATPFDGQRRTDEVGTLASAFERMRINVADQQQEIRKLAYWDTLTGLPNRVQFRNAVLAAVTEAAKTGRSVAVVMLDLDRFKHVNDLLGYQYGDLMLKAVAGRMSQQAVRGKDMIARIDGDGFAVLLADLDTGAAVSLTRAVALRIHDAFGSPIALEDQTVDMSASIGMAVWPHYPGDGETLLGNAEVALSMAKRRTQSPMLYDPAFDAGSSQSLSMLSGLRNAVDHGELRLYLQPKLALAGARIVGAEALLRWHHPERGMLLPGEFIPFAEQTGFIRVLTMWVFEEAVRLWNVFSASGTQIGFSVNLSTRDLLDLELPQKFEAVLIRHTVPAEVFCLEITESAIMDDPQRALATLNRLSALGFRLSIDDFGTGYSSLAYLKRLPVDELKIDKSFVMNMEKDADDARIVRSTIELAHAMGLSVVAEGVEDAKVWTLLRELSCDEAQGYHMAKPMPAHEFAHWSAHWAARHVGQDPQTGPSDKTIVLH
jgi:diguanylate cyclase (GGDEF)-like protein